MVRMERCRVSEDERDHENRCAEPMNTDTKEAIEVLAQVYLLANMSKVADEVFNSDGIESAMSALMRGDSLPMIALTTQASLELACTQLDEDYDYYLGN